MEAKSERNFALSALSTDVRGSFLLDSLICHFTDFSTVTSKRRSAHLVLRTVVVILHYHTVGINSLTKFVRAM
jgi:hypothetical protein